MTRWRPPTRGDRDDRRCAFVTKNDEPGAHAPLDKMHWCFGCEHYVCDKCNETWKWTGPAHEVADHQPGEGA